MFLCHASAPKKKKKRNLIAAAAAARKKKTRLDVAFLQPRRKL